MKDCIKCNSYRKIHTRGMCKSCYNSFLKTANDNDVRKKKRNGLGSLRKDGYIVLMVKGKRILQHTHIMQINLNRTLFKGEFVHHKNGVRNDNRIENLELWTINQPNGQRVQDKIDWAKSFLESYGYKISQ